MSSQNSFPGPAAPTRRSLLKAATATVALTGLPWAARAATTGGEADFANLSRYLTGKPVLDTKVQAALYEAFLSIDAGFAAKLAQLRGLIETQGVAASDLNAHLTQAAPDLVKLPQEILTGWYLGVAGSGKGAKCVTYANDLANAAVADVLSPPSYAYGPCNSWAAKPV